MPSNPSPEERVSVRQWIYELWLPLGLFAVAALCLIAATLTGVPE